MQYFLLLISIFLLGCEQPSEKQTVSETLTCRGIYYQRDEFGDLKKINHYLLEGRCLTENQKLSHFEETEEKWQRNKTQCLPQPNFSSQTLVAANNFYDYRDNRAYLDFDASTGIFRRIVLSENQSGEPSYSKMQGCFYQRTGTGVDSSFGKQLLLDTDVNKIISSQYFDPMEIFTYTETGAQLNMIRFDDVSDHDYTFCPYLNTPLKFCSALRDGNIMFFANLTTAEKAVLTSEGKLISQQYNWITTSKSSFDSLWDSVSSTRKEISREDQLYDVIQIPDVPRFIDQAWRAYVMGSRPTMPNVSSPTLPQVCYSGSQTVSSGNGSKARIFGEICFINGTYTFTQN